MRVTVKKPKHEVKTILSDAIILLNINLLSEFQKAEFLGEQVLLYFRRYSSKIVMSDMNFLGTNVKYSSSLFWNKNGG